jgi:lysophospholipase L1-like esterase
MPIINIAPKAMQNGDNVTTYKDTVGPQQQTYTFLTSQERVILKNSGSKNITYTVGSQSGTLGPSQTVEVKETISSINLTAEQGTQQFEVWADELGTKGTSPEAVQLADIATRSKLVPTALRSLPSTMSTPPTVTMGAANAVSSITGVNSDTMKVPALVSGLPNPLFRYIGDIQQASSNFPNDRMVSNKAVTINIGYGNFSVEFDIYDNQFEIMWKGQGQAYRVLVDEGNGYQIAYSGITTKAPNDGSFHFELYQFSSFKFRKILIEIDGGWFGGINISNTGTLFPPTRKPTPKAVIFGDSFTGGSGADGASITGYAEQLSLMMGWDYWNSGVGGTGYMNPGTQTTFGTRVQHDVIGYNPDVVLIQGGQNDTTYTATQVQSAATTLYNIIKSALPNALVVVLGNFSLSGTPTTNITNTRDALKAAALSAGLPYIDPISGITYDSKGVAIKTTSNWWTGTGRQGATTGNGNADLFTWTDNGHPSQAGHDYITRRTATEIQRLFV